MILDYGKTGFPDTAGQAVQLEIQLSRLIGVDRLVQAGKCLLYNANQYSFMSAVFINQSYLEKFATFVTVIFVIYETNNKYIL